MKYNVIRIQTWTKIPLVDNVATFTTILKGTCEDKNWYRDIYLPPPIIDQFGSMLLLLVRVFFNHLGDVMLSVFVSSVVDSRFELLDVVNPKL